MRVIVDANRIMSSILKDGSTRRVLLDATSELFAPTYLRVEIDTWRMELSRRTGLTTDQFDALLDLLLGRISWVADADIAELIPRARAALSDPKDAPYLAAALAIGADAIWSEDRDFDAQDLVPRTRHPDRLER